MCMYKKRGYYMKIIAVSNQKGGVGKTTTATNLAYGLQLKEKRVLLVDCDPQGNSSDTWRASKADGYPTLSDLLFTDEPAEECIQHTEIGDILAADNLLEEVDVRLKGVSGYYRLKNRLESLKADYDYIILDTPPNLGLLLQNALIAADEVIVPLTTSKYALDGMGRFIETVNEVKSMPNPKLKVLGLLFVKYMERKVLAKEVESGLPEVLEQLNTTVFNSKIRLDEAVEQSQAARMPVYAYSPKARATSDYVEFTEEIEREVELNG